MPSRYQQHFYRAAFFLLCVAPTVYTLGYIVERRMSAAAAAEESEVVLPIAEADLSKLLGVRVTLAGMEYLPDHVTRLTGMKLFDPETGALLAAAESLDMFYAEGGVLAIEPVGVSLEAGQLPRLAEILHRRVLREMPSTFKLEAACGTVQLVGGAREETVSHVTLSMAHSEGMRQATLRFRPAWAPQSGLLQIEIARQLAGPSPITSITFRTGGQSLPVSWFASVIPAIANLGDACQFQGTLASQETTAGWESTFAGTFSQVELDRLVAPNLRRHPLGTAQLKVDRSRSLGGRLAEAEGWIGADSLPVSIRLAETLTALGLVPQEPLSRGEALQSGLVAFHAQLSCRFTLDAHGLLLHGDEGIVLREGQVPLLGQPESLVRWTARLAAHCSDLGLPPLEMLPHDADPPRSPIRLLRDDQ